MPEVTKVAIITRTRNRPNLLRRAIESVLGQTYGDWRHVIVNDGGDPEVLDALCGEFSDRYEGRLLVLHEKHQGMQAVANAAIHQSESTYIVIHDDDDSWHPDFLAETTGFLDAEGQESRYQGVIARTLRILEKEDGKGGFKEIERRPYIPIKEVNLFRAGYENPFPPIAFLFRRSVHEEIGYFDPRWDMVADLDFNFRFLQRFEIGVVDKPLAFYHWRDDDATGEYANTVTRKQERHGRYLNELKNHYIRKASSAREAALALGFQLSSFVVENQWMTTEIRERSNEAIVHLKSLIGQIEHLHAFNHEALWPKMTGDIIGKLDGILETTGELQRLRGLIHESRDQLLDSIHKETENLQAFNDKALWPKLNDLGREIENLQAFNDKALWPKLTEDILPRLDHLIAAASESSSALQAILHQQQVFQHETLWPKLEDFSNTIQYVSETLEAVWEKQGELQQDNITFREEIRKLREQSKRQWQIGRLRLQWLPDRKTSHTENSPDK